MYEKDLLPSGSAALPLPEPIEVPSDEAVIPTDQDVDVVVPGGLSPAPVDSIEVSGGDSEASPGGYWIYIPGKDVSGSDMVSVSSGDVHVSGGNADSSHDSGVKVYVSESIDSPDYSQCFDDLSMQIDDVLLHFEALEMQFDSIGEQIDACGALLSLIVGLFLFYWCHARIRNAVRSFIGRNAIDD